MRRLSQVLVILVTTLTISGCTLNPMEYKAKSGLQVITNDQPSAVFINGQYINKTPLIEKNLKPGQYTISIQPEDTEYVPYETSITLRKGLLTVITWKPDKRPELSSGVILEMEALDDRNNTEVKFTTIPDAAIINFFGRKEFSPVIIPDVTAGVQEFEVTLPSYETQHHSINVQPGYRTHVTVKLGKLQSTDKQDPEANADITNAQTASTSGVGGVTATTADTSLNNSASGTASASGTITILKTGFFQDGKEVVRVRETPDARGTERGFAQVSTTYPYLGEQKNGWYKISFNGSPGWVNGAYAQLQ